MIPAISPRTADDILGVLALVGGTIWFALLHSLPVGLLAGALVGGLWLGYRYLPSIVQTVLDFVMLASAVVASVLSVLMLSPWLAAIAVVVLLGLSVMCMRDIAHRGA